MLLALTGLCHIILAIWAVGATCGVAVRFRFARSRARRGLPCSGGRPRRGGGGSASCWRSTRWRIGLALAAVGAVAALAGLWLVSDGVRWLSPTIVVGGLLSVWWVGPFYLRSAYLNDMGWEKLPYQDREIAPERVGQHLFPCKTPDVDLRWVFALALLGVGHQHRPAPAGRHLPAALHRGGRGGVRRRARGPAVERPPAALLLPDRHAAGRPGRVRDGCAPWWRWSGDGRPDRAGRRPGRPSAPWSCVLVLVGLPLGATALRRARRRRLRLARRSARGGCTPSPPASSRSWADVELQRLRGQGRLPRVPRHRPARWRELGEERGCGRAFWEYEEELDRYGTPMALMLLPHWTDGCIGSMEGLYFEASATTPFHFLTQVELSTAPSAAQRDLPYGSFDIDRGVHHLQMMGVRYYMATSDKAISAGPPAPRPDRGGLVRAVGGVRGGRQRAGRGRSTNEPAVIEGVDDSQARVGRGADRRRRALRRPRRRAGSSTPSRWDVPLAHGRPRRLAARRARRGARGPARRARSR